ncbi:hypothetical protein HK103_005544 [Boothiomyces macroporosus]|uniref:Enoyl reductase (ER) domain-containing protein n=1 Tax=Boothiomyces macroporosus TaxID=261099 RepID=A0AAD5UF63_9FUNG|nr:hypothetical protein HK103_005544 [Boothiomyces macroporosus]
MASSNMTISVNKQVLFKQDPGAGWVETSHMEVVDRPLNVQLKQGEVLLKNLYLSVDPYMRGRMNTAAKSYSAPFTIGQPLTGGGISEVVESQRDGYAKGDLISSHIGWEQYTVVPAQQPIQKIVNPLNVPLSYFLGILGMPGATAYHGLLDIGEPKEGETVFVSGAAGAVGLVVGQIAKIKGCRVVGSAGTDEKVEQLVSTFGYDAAFNYKTVASQHDKLKELCPKGIDVYFDNVGGETLETVLSFMNTHGRLVECGMISQYNAEKPYGIKNLMLVVGRQLKIQGFIISSQLASKDFVTRFVGDMTKWIKEGKLSYTETITDGLENAPQAFVDMLKGANTGKQIIKIA